MSLFGIVYLSFGTLYILCCILDSKDVKNAIRRGLAKKFDLYEEQYISPKFCNPHIIRTLPYSDIKLEKICCTYLISEYELFAEQVLTSSGRQPLMENARENILRRIFSELVARHIVTIEVSDDEIYGGKRVYGEVFVGIKR